MDPSVKSIHSFTPQTLVLIPSMSDPVLGTGITKVFKIQASFILVGQIRHTHEQLCCQENLRTQERKGLPGWGGDSELTLALKGREN